MNRLAGALGAMLLLAAVAKADAVTLDDLFEVTVQATGAAESQAFRAGMADVLVRVTGRRDAATMPALAGLIGDAQRYVMSYRRVAGGQLAIAFDGDAVAAAVAASGLPFWGADRPLTLVWLAVDRGGGQRGLVTAGATSGERQAMERAAAQRGLPLAWPSLGAGLDPLQRFEQVRSGDIGALAAAAGDYGAQGSLIGHARLVAGRGYTVDWTLVGAGGSQQGSGGLEDGVNLAADRYASLYASVAAARSSEVDVTVVGIDSGSRYAQVVRHLESLAVVRSLGVREVGGEAVAFRLAIRGDLGVLTRAVNAGGLLEQAATVTGEPVFRMRR